MPIEDGKGVSSASPTPKPSGQTGAKKSFKDIHEGSQAQDKQSSKGGFSSFQKFLGKKNYKLWLKSFNMSIVKNIKKDQEHEKKVSDQLKASTEGGNIWDV